jgi:hypothetical protein
MMTATRSIVTIVRLGNTSNATIPTIPFRIFTTAESVNQGLWTEKVQLNGKSAYENSLTVVTGKPNALLRPKATIKRSSSLPLQ